VIRVRAATEVDVPRLVEISRHSATAAQWSQDQYVNLFAPEQLQNHVSLVIEEGTEVVGFIVGRLLSQECEIENVMIKGTARRRGLGSRLLGEFLDHVRSQGGQEIWLEVRESNVAARALYEKWAFREEGRRRGYYQGPTEDALILRFEFGA